MITVLSSFIEEGKRIWRVTDGSGTYRLNQSAFMWFIARGFIKNVEAVNLSNTKVVCYTCGSGETEVIVYDRLGNEVSNLNKTEGLERRLESSKDAYDFMLEKHKKLAREHDELRGSIEVTVESYVKKIEELARLNKELKEQNSRLADKNKRLKDTIDELEEADSNLCVVNDSLEKELEELKTKYQNIEAELLAKTEETKLVEKKIEQVELRNSLTEQLLSEHGIEVTEEQQNEDTDDQKQRKETSKEAVSKLERLKEVFEESENELQINIDFIGNT